jgi:hypothetical protein
MALVRDLNRGVRSGNEALWYLRVLLLQAGWTVPTSGSGNGGLYSASGDVFIGFAHGGQQVASGSFGWGSCWIVLQSPGGEEWLFQRYSNNSDDYDDRWFVGYSASGGYSGAPTNTPDATTAPATADGQTLHNGGGLFSDDLQPMIVHIIADTEPTAAGGYGFIMLGFHPSTSVHNHLSTVICQDPYLNADPGNPHPWALGVSITQGFPTPATLQLKTWSHYGEGGETWITAYYGWYQDSTGTINPTGAYPGTGYDGKERPLPIPIHEEANGYVSGVSKWFSWSAIDRDYPQKAEGSPYLYLGNAMVYGWDPAESPVFV